MIFEIFKIQFELRLKNSMSQKVSMIKIKFIELGIDRCLCEKRLGSFQKGFGKGEMVLFHCCKFIVLFSIVRT